MIYQLITVYPDKYVLIDNHRRTNTSWWQINPGEKMKIEIQVICHLENTERHFT